MSIAFWNCLIIVTSIALSVTAATYYDREVIGEIFQLHEQDNFDCLSSTRSNHAAVRESDPNKFSYKCVVDYEKGFWFPEWPASWRTVALITFLSFIAYLGQTVVVRVCKRIWRGFLLQFAL